ncbi:hypothetical protein LX99_02370 [Mucilaginibacter oryzae]|uniref:Uncharacterized protein n=1 Tax=Mucilaginibacter oryzae TaxID=468058 RepID=A0A316HDC6_9SPHI|nr:hypothetical protein LX99_02370 [Mucilaginibacter oryzae]
MVQNKKYCCNSFLVEVSLPNTTAPNIRIVGFKPRPGWEQDKLYLNFFFTMGYKEFSLDLPNIRFDFCPFCGTTLREFYKLKDYCNEFEGETFTIPFV